MSVLTTDNRNLAEIEDELRARIEAQRIAIDEVRAENHRLNEENRRLRGLLGMGPLLSCTSDLSLEVS